MAFKMKGHPLKKHKTGHIPPREKGDNLKERFLAKRAAKAEKKFDDYLDESGSVESRKGDRLLTKEKKAIAAHDAYTKKRAEKAVAKNEKKKNKGKRKSNMNALMDASSACTHTHARARTHTRAHT